MWLTILVRLFESKSDQSESIADEEDVDNVSETREYFMFWVKTMLFTLTQLFTNIVAKLALIRGGGTNK